MTNTVTKFMWYMFNKWSLKEATTLFGDNLGKHIFTKWLDDNDDLFWYGSLDIECRDKIVERAKEIYKNY